MEFAFMFALVFADFFRDAALSAAVFLRGFENVFLAVIALDLDALGWVALASEFLTALVFGLNDGIFVELTAFWLWALNAVAFFWNADMLEAAIVDLVRHEVFIEFTHWNFWAVTVEALDVTTFTTRANTADVAFGVPRFSEETWAFVGVEASWALWSGWAWATSHWDGGWWST